MGFLSWIRSEDGPDTNAVEALRKTESLILAELDFLRCCINAYEAGFADGRNSVNPIVRRKGDDETA